MTATCASYQSIPHAVRAANAFYSPPRKALLLGYFCGVADARRRNPARRPDLRRHCRPTSWRTRRRTRCWMDCTAFSSGRATTTCLRSTRRSPISWPSSSTSRCPNCCGTQSSPHAAQLRRSELLGGLAVQLGRAIGKYAGLRNAIGAFESGSEEACDAKARGTRRPGSHTLNAKLRPSLSKRAVWQRSVLVQVTETMRRNLLLQPGLKLGKLAEWPQFAQLLRISPLSREAFREAPVRPRSVIELLVAEDDRRSGVTPVLRTPKNGGYLPRWSPPEWTSVRDGSSPQSSRMRRLG
jgi:hypothetical protein